jgi:hypothetical protein
MSTNEQLHPLQGLKDQYDQLCAKRDAKYAEVQPLEDELAATNAAVEQLQLKAADLAKQIEDAWGGAAWITLKKQIAVLAKGLGAPGGILAVKK